MLIKALCDYADKREVGRKEKVIPEGWSEQNVHFKINLSPEGDIVSIDDVRITEKVIAKNGKEKENSVPRKVILPERIQKSATAAYMLDHRPLYIFGLDFDKNEFTESSKARKSHAAFVKHELDFFEDLDSEICMAYRKFIEKWVPADETENPALLEIKKNYSVSGFRFALSGARGFLEEDSQFVEKYNRIYAESKNDSSVSDDEMQVCGILGEKLPVAKTHEKVKKLPGGHPSGNIMVGMNEKSSESYGKTQSYNSNISEQAMKKYTSTLNMLIEDKKHCVMIKDLAIIFFAMKSDDSKECDCMCDFLSSSPTDTEKSLESMFRKAQGGSVGDTNYEIDNNVIFYIAGLTSSSISRISQKFIYRNKFGTIVENLIQHQKDLQIDSENDKPIVFSMIEKQLVSPEALSDSSSSKVPPPLLSSIILSALNGTNYPNALLENVVRRIKTDRDIEEKHFINCNYIRTGIIKACINRKMRNSGKKEEFTMALDLENNNGAYLCGRLFAVYEKIQKEASGGELNRTIKDSYFASACARPATIAIQKNNTTQDDKSKSHIARRTMKAY
ncbi:MAG: type I-C CRISPR-associated protein Cas8c/Csd1 [Ruminococcus sp.]